MIGNPISLIYTFCLSCITLFFYSIEVTPLRMSLRSRNKLPLDEIKTEQDLETKKSTATKINKSGTPITHYFFYFSL